MIETKRVVWLLTGGASIGRKCSFLFMRIIFENYRDSALRAVPRLHEHPDNCCRN